MNKITRKSTKRIPVTPKTWADLHQQRRPGESYDLMLQRILDEASQFRLIKDMENDENNEFVSLEEIDKK